MVSALLSALVGSLFLPALCFANLEDVGEVPLQHLLSGQWHRDQQATAQEPLSDGDMTAPPPACVTSRTTAFEQHSGPVPFSTSAGEHLEVPKLPKGINTTAWEQWEFDAITRDGTAGGSILMGFSRDASYAFFGQGNLRVEFYMVLGDGTVVQDLDYVDESTIVWCEGPRGGGIFGVWNSSSGSAAGPRTYAFHVPADMGSARVWWDTGRSRGSLKLASRTPPHLADGRPWPGQAKTTEMAPSLFFNQPIAGARATADVMVGRKQLRFEGDGGHGRLWARDGWFAICDGWYILRAFAGPYVIAYWEPVSRLDGGKSYYSAQLFRDGELLVSTQAGMSGNASGSDVVAGDHVIYTPAFGGPVSGTLADRSTGRVIEFFQGSGRERRRWRFTLTHRSRMFQMGLGSGKGLTGFIDSVEGGEVTKDGGNGAEPDIFTGNGFSEQVALPAEIKQWQIWVVYGIGFLGKWKSVLLNRISALL